jgi:SpoVK/Ycf46/Vps4 family AAA+-type ATPase
MTQAPSGPLHRALKPRPQWTQLALPPEQRELLHQITEHVGHQQKAQDAKGLVVLFAGGPGSGKTTAARAIAGALRRDLFWVDLSAVVDKYIGETEKNLDQLFAAAEAASAVLLFDEADALFGQRSEVKDSHDRYANLEVAYLLRRLEAHSGLVILTANRKQAIDPAFLRRLRFVIDFPPSAVPVVPRLVP